jgi:predicted HNH restriction endonuclease
MRAFRNLWRRLQRWSIQRVVKCDVCGIESGKVYGNLAERMAKNHTRSTGHARVRVLRVVRFK